MSSLVLLLVLVVQSDPAAQSDRWRSWDVQKELNRFVSADAKESGLGYSNLVGAIQDFNTVDEESRDYRVVQAKLGMVILTLAPLLRDKDFIEKRRADVIAAGQLLALTRHPFALQLVADQIDFGEVAPGRPSLKSGTDLYPFVQALVQPGKELLLASEDRFDILGAQLLRLDDETKFDLLSATIERVFRSTCEGPDAKTQAKAKMRHYLQRLSERHMKTSKRLKCALEVYSK